MIQYRRHLLVHYEPLPRGLAESEIRPDYSDDNAKDLHDHMISYPHFGLLPSGRNPVSNTTESLTNVPQNFLVEATYAEIRVRKQGNT